MIIPKSGGVYRGIFLLEFIWNVYVLIINNRPRDAITLHDAVHEFIEGRESGTATMEVKLSHQLAVMVHEPLLQIFLDV